MTFKQDWEKTDQRVILSNEVITAMVRQAFPDDTLDAYEKACNNEMLCEHHLFSHGTDVFSMKI